MASKLKERKVRKTCHDRRMAPNPVELEPTASHIERVVRETGQEFENETGLE